MNAKFTLLAAFLALGALAGCGTAQGVEQNIDRAINDLTRGVDSFEQAVDVLQELKGDMDEGTYKNQVENLIRTTGQVGQLTYEGSLDFTRTRLIEDLENMKRRLRGQEPLPRKPVLASTDNVRIKLDDPARSTVTIVGWNLDTAAGDPEKYSVSVHNLAPQTSKIPKTRTIDADFIAYQGQYAVTVNISKTGFPLKHYDSKIVFNGYDKDFEVVIVDSAPPPTYEVTVSGTLYVYDHVEIPIPSWAREIDKDVPQYDDKSGTVKFEKSYKLEPGESGFAGSEGQLASLVVQGAEGRVHVSLVCDNEGRAKVRFDLKLFHGLAVYRPKRLGRAELLEIEVKPGDPDQATRTAESKKDRMELAIKVSIQEIRETAVNPGQPAVTLSQVQSAAIERSSEEHTR